MLLLDGLDEVKPVQRETCVKVINNFRSEHGQAQMVVCSRIADYEALPTQLKLGGAVLIQPLTPQQIDEYLKRAGNEMATVREALRSDSELQELAQLPLMLGVMTLAYRGLTAKAIADKPLSTIEARRRHLFDTYTRQVFERVGRTKNEFYMTDQALHWLAWLAQKMTKHAQLVFLLEQMPLNWLPTRQQRLHLRFDGLIGALVFGLIFGLLYGVFTHDPRFAPLGAIVGGLGGLQFGQREVWRVAPVKWSWEAARGGFITGMGWGIVVGIGIVSLVMKESISIVFVLSVGLIFGLVGGLVIGSIRGLSSTEIQTRTSPCEAIWQSTKNALVVGLISVLVSVLVSVSVGGLVFGPVDGPVAGLFLGIGVALFFGPLFGLTYGGMSVISHLTLRFIFYRNGDIPWNYVRFLDYATEHIFLRSVGGGYIFIHRMLMEYFAALEMEPSDGYDERSSQRGT